MSTPVKSNKPLIILLVILLLSNLSMLLYFTVFKKPEGQKGMRGNGKFSVVEHVTKEVGFTEAQSAEFRKLLEANRDSMNRLSENVKNAKKGFYALLREEASDSAVQAAVAQLSRQQAAVELQMFRHFRNVRRLCTDDQQKTKYDTLINRMINQPPWFRKNSSNAKPGEEKK